MAKKTSIMNIVTTKIGLLTAFLVVIFGIIFLRSAYELVNMFLKDIIMSLGITNDYQIYIALAVIGFAVMYFIGKGKWKGIGK